MGLKQDGRRLGMCVAHSESLLNPKPSKPETLNRRAFVLGLRFRA